MLRPSNSDLDEATAVVFLGPSLPSSRAKELLDCTVLGPVERGDIDDLLSRCKKLNAIGIVDGRFFQSMSVSPKEVLRAIDKGIRLYGASSMGALRATELAVHGMIGVGEIYDLFASGELDADDEVAVVFDADTLEPVSESLVNIRIALRRARDEGLISKGVSDRAIEVASGMFYPRRSYRAIVHALEREIPPQDLQALKAVCAGPYNAKYEDAQLMLMQMRDAQRWKHMGDADRH